MIFSYRYLQIYTTISTTNICELQFKYSYIYTSFGYNAPWQNYNDYELGVSTKQMNILHNNFIK